MTPRQFHSDADTVARVGEGLTRRDWAWMVGATALAALVRLVYLSQIRSSPLANHLIMDGRSYWRWADRLLGGDWFGGEVFYQAPAYPYLLGVLRVLGADAWDVRIIQCCAGAGSCALLYLAARLWFSTRVAIVSAFMFALYPPAMFFDVIIQKANLGLVLTTLVLWLFARAWKRPVFLRAVALGAALGGLMLTREETILLFPVAVFVLVAADLRSGRSGSRRALAGAPAAAGLCIGAAVLLAPVAVRNYRVGGEFLLTTSQAGPNFYIGNNAAATGIYAPLREGRSNTPLERRDAFELAEQAMGRKLTPAQVSSYWMERALRFIRERPGAWLALMGRKVVLLLNDVEVPDAESQYDFDRYSPITRIVGTVWRFGVLGPLATLGVVLTWGRRRTIWPLYLLILTMGASVVLFYVFARYRSPLVPVLIPFAAAGVWSLADAVRGRRWISVAMGCAASAVVAVPAFWPVLNRDRLLASTLVNAGAALAEAGDDARAIQLYESALAIDPQLDGAVVNLALVLGRARRLSEAHALLQSAQSRRPKDPRLLFLMGTLQAEMGELSAAISSLSRAVELAPQDVDSATNLSMLLLQERRFVEAASHLRACVGRFPDDVGMHASLAWLLATCPDASVRNGPEAITTAMRAVSLAPGPSPDLLDILGAAHAEAGDFASAVILAGRAADLARTTRVPAGFIEAIEARVKLYKASAPFREQ